MKLYTEEQVRKTLDNEDVAYIANIVIAQMQPIELPSDEEIEKVAEKTLSVNLIGFIKGAKWLKEQILKNNL